MEFPSACWRLEYQRGPEDWFRYGERGLRQREGKGERKKKARLETRKGQAIFIASDDFIPGCETSRRGQTLETMEFGGQAENPLVTPPALSPNPGQFRKPRLVAPTPGVEFRTFQTFGRHAAQGSAAVQGKKNQLDSLPPDDDDGSDGTPAVRPSVRPLPHPPPICAFRLGIIVIVAR